MNKKLINDIIRKIDTVEKERGFATVYDLSYSENIFFQQLIDLDYLDIENNNNNSFITNSSILRLINSKIKLSKKGRIQLFIINNQKKYNTIINLVKLYGYNKEDLINYLLSMKELNFDKFDILKFKLFILENDIPYNKVHKKI